jgi:hypothetical protein
MPLRWSGSEEPISLFSDSTGTVKTLFDPVKYNAAFRKDCIVGTQEQIDVAARFDDDDECYGWSNESYLPGKGWRNEDWKLPKGRYLVSVAVTFSGETVREAFEIENSVSIDSFRIESASRSKRKLLSVKRSKN